MNKINRQSVGWNQFKDHFTTKQDKRKKKENHQKTARSAIRKMCTWMVLIMLKE